MLRIQNVLLNPGLNCGFDHDFLPGGMTVVLGRNQAGKTNLCRLIAGLSTQAVGELSLNDETLNKLSPQKRSVAVVFQAFVNYPNWSVQQNIASPMVAAGRDKAYIHSRVVELAEKLGLGELLQRMPNELSGGQQQRLAIARALAKEAQVLLLDEPLVNLDYKLREALALELRSLLDDSDTTVIYTTTDPKDAFTLGDDLLLLEGGNKLQAGVPLCVYQKPNTFAAANLMSDPGINTFAWSTLTDQTFAQQSQAAGGVSALGGVRPEHLFFVDKSEFNAEECIGFDLQVSALETSGDETFVHGVVQASNRGLSGHQLSDRQLSDPKYSDHKLPDPGTVNQPSWVVRSPGMLNFSQGQVLLVAVQKRDILAFGGQ